jgi:AcrR family transcriptional regulator
MGGRGRVNTVEPASESTGVGAPAGRVARRRERAYRRIVAAAEGLIAERGVDGVTVDAIAGAADIARRSFYHHFESKHDLLVPIARARTRALNRRIDRLVATIDDPAEVMATAIRHALREITADPLCSWFVLHSGLPHERLYAGMGESGMRDALRAIESGRFRVENFRVVRVLVSAAFIAALGARVAGKLDDADLDDGVEHLLRLFGLDAEDARGVAHRPLPTLPEDPGAADEPDGERREERKA